MSRSLLKTEFDEASMLRKLKKLAKDYGEKQDQAVKRWGVQTCRDLAKYSQIFGDKPKWHKLTLFKDANNVIGTHEGRAKKTPKGRSFISNGKKRFIPDSKYLTSENDIIVWVEQNRRSSNKRTVKLSQRNKKYCSNAMLRRAINIKYKKTAGLAKDGWLDAGDDISRGQKGRNPARISKGLMKFARKPERFGKSKQGKGLVNSFGILENLISYSGNNHVLSEKNKRLAINDGAKNTMKWYAAAIRAENRKKK